MLGGHEKFYAHILGLVWWNITNKILKLLIIYFYVLFFTATSLTQNLNISCPFFKKKTRESNQQGKRKAVEAKGANRKQQNTGKERTSRAADV